MINSNPFELCAGNLASLPTKYKFWKTLGEYRSEWHFLPYALKQRVSEQCMAFDYLLSIGEWLNPSLTIGEKHKIIIVQTLASIYEGVLSCIIDHKISNEKKVNPLFEVTFNNDRYGEKRTFGPTLKLALKIGIIDSHWSSYLGQINEIRNWIHLSKEAEGPLLKWLYKQKTSSFREKLEEFRLLMEKSR